MSVLIKDMEMPKGCYDCMLCRLHPIQRELRFCCEVINRAFEASEESEMEKKRLFDCPLVEVPAPHGRLIDEDNVIDAIHERLQTLRTHKEFIKKHGDIDLLGVMPYIAKIPTVIEAEEGENK